MHPILPTLLSLSPIPFGSALPAAAATSDAAGVTEVLAGLFILFVGAKVGEELFRRLGQPAVVGELVGGFVVGPHALGLVSAGLLGPDGTAAVMAELGVVMLLFAVGLEVRTDDLLAVGRPAIVTAIVAMVLPIIAGLAVGIAVGESLGTSAFFGLALAATSIGITSRVLAEFGVLDRRFSRVILGAAIVDDILALVLIGVVSGAVTGDLSATTVIVAVAGVGLVALGFVIARRARGLRREVFTWPLFADTPLVPAFMFMLALALVAAAVGLAAIIGAFVAGLIVAETEAQDEIEHEMRPLVSIFTPFFFAFTGAEVQLDALLKPEVFVLAIVLGLLGVVTKVVGGTIGAWSLGRWGAVTVGFGMVPRGEVGIVVAGLGLSLGLLTADLFSEVLAAVVITTIVAPYLLRISIPRAIAAATEAGEDQGPVESR
jgi:Kef-type K+ transport system membrane component KefB